jgi:hypothetical protein
MRIPTFSDSNFHGLFLFHKYNLLLNFTIMINLLSQNQCQHHPGDIDNVPETNLLNNVEYYNVQIYLKKYTQCENHLAFFCNIYRQF